MTVSFDLNKVFKYCVMTFVCIGTLFYVPLKANMNPEDAVNLGYLYQDFFFRYGALFLFSFSCLLAPKRVINLKSMSILFIYFIFLALLMNFDLKMRVHLLNFGIGLLFVKTISEHFEDKSVKFIGKFFIALILINLVLMALQYFRLDPILTAKPHTGSADLVVGFMRAKVHLGVLAAILAPFIYAVNPWLVLLCLPLLYFSVSSVAVCAFCLSFLLLSWFDLKRKAFIGLVLALFLIGAAYVLKYDMPGGQFGDRFKVWHQTISFSLKTNPVLGVGIGSFSKWNPTTVQGTTEERLPWIWAHNEYLQTYFEGGLFALFLMWSYVAGFFKNMIRLISDRESRAICASFLTVLMISFFHFPFHLSRLAIPCLFIMAMYEIKASKCKTNI